MDQIYKFTNFIYKIAPAKKQQVCEMISEVKKNSLNYHGRSLVRIAGLSGAVAVILGAYGAHSLKNSKASDERKQAFETGNRYHLIHSVALLATPLTSKPRLVACLLLGGMILFSGSCYLYALTDNKKVTKVTPIGGMLFIAAWASMIL